MSRKGIKLFLYFLAALILLNGLSCNANAKCPTRMGSDFIPEHFLVIAHRGSTLKFPENTLPAFDAALNVDGANALEVDLSLTQDKKVVLWHDWDPDHPIALIREKGKEPVVKFKPSGPSEESGLRKKVSELSLVELREHYGYEEKVTREKSKLQIPNFKDFMEWAVGQEKLKAVFFKFKGPCR